MTLYINPQKTLTSISQHRSAVIDQISGREFPFGSDNPTSRNRATRLANEVSQEAWLASEQRAGRELTSREVLSYQAPDPRQYSNDPDERRKYRADHTELQTVSESEENPYLLGLKNDAGRVRGDSQKYPPEFKAEMLRKSEIWDAERAIQRDIAAQEANPTFIRAMSHAVSSLESARTFETDQTVLDNLADLLIIAKNDPQAYWDAVFSADEERRRKESDASAAAVVLARLTLKAKELEAERIKSDAELELSKANADKIERDAEKKTVDAEAKAKKDEDEDEEED